MPEFSVIVCTYNRSELITEAIECLLGQTYDDFEIVVVDDGSTDDTRARVTAFSDPRVRYVHRENGGLSAARNTGVAASHGRYVTFVDDDDRPNAVWLERFAAVLRDGAAVVSCGARWVDQDGNEIKRTLPYDLGLAFAGYRGFYQAGTFAMTRQAFDAVGGFAEELRGSHQTELALRLLPLCRERAWEVGVIDEQLLTITLRPAQGRARNAPERLLTTTLYIIDHHHDRLAQSPEILANYYATAGVAAARSGSFRESRRLLRSAVRTSRSNSRRGKHAARLFLAYVPPVARSVWRSDTFDPAAMQ